MMNFTDVNSWRKWALENAKAGHTVFRLTLQRHVSQMSVKALILCVVQQEDRATLGVITFNNQPNKHVSISSRHALECAVAGDDRSGGWDVFLALNASLEAEWLAESGTVCLFEDVFEHNFAYISAGSFLAMEYIARVYGMIYHAAATAEDADKKAVLRLAEEHLDRLLAHKRRDIASLAAGL